MQGLNRLKTKKSIHDKQNQHNNRQFINRTMSLKQGPIKPTFLQEKQILTPIDINETQSFEDDKQLLSQILGLKVKERKLSNSQAYLEDYSHCLRQESMNLQPLGAFLDNHKIDSNLRSRMLDWMTEVTSSYKFEAKSYFDGVYFLDKYFRAKNRPVEPTELHSLGVVSMFIASKIHEILPLRIGMVYEKIGHRKISIKELTQVEADLVQTLEYKLNMWTFYDVASISISSFKDNTMLETLTYICRLVAIEYEFYSSVKPSLLGEGCAWLVCEIFNEQEPKWMNDTFRVRQLGHQILSLLIGFSSIHPNFKNAEKFADKQALSRVFSFIKKIENDI